MFRLLFTIVTIFKMFYIKNFFLFFVIEIIENI